MRDAAGACPAHGARGRREGGRRAGSALLEAMAAMVTGILLCGAMAALLQWEERLSLARGRRLARAEALRVTAGVLRREVAMGDPAADIGLVAGDTLPLRAFRGLAVTCAPAADGSVVARYEGDRLPDPERDSLLPLGSAAGAPLALAEAIAATGVCPGSGAQVRLSFAAAQAPPVLPPGTPLLVFERGIYALSGSALRFRRGAEGRQPLTGEWLDDRRTRLAPVLAADTAGGSALVALHVALTVAGTGVRRRLRVPLLNRGLPP